MTKIKITRSKEKINSERKIDIYLDKKKIGTVSNEEIKEFSINTGKHNLRAKIDWCGSANFPIDVNNNETKEFTISAFRTATILFKYYKKARPIIIGLVLFVIIFNKFIYAHLANWSILLGLPIFIPLLILIYYLSFGRNKYLVINERK